MLCLQDVCKSYYIGKQEIAILKNINVKIERGEFVAIVGASGCGKTTLLNIIAGMDTVKTGYLRTDTENCTRFKEKQWAKWRRNHIGYIFQNFNLIDFMTAKQNIELVMSSNRMSKKERSERADLLLNMVGLADRGRHKPMQLSGGQKQRVAIARALANEPDIILADEPTGAVDSKNAQEIIDLLKKINREQNVTIIMVTHDERLAMQAERKIVMSDGMIIKDVHQKSKKENIIIHKKNDFREMSLRSSLNIAYKNITTKKKRTFLTAFATAIGITGVMLVLGIGGGTKSRLLKELGTFINNQVVDIEVECNEEIGKSKCEVLSETEGVENIYPQYSINAALQYNDVIVSGLVEPIAPISYKIPYWEDNLEVGRMPAADDSQEILVTMNLAKQLFGQKYKDIIGQQVNMVYKAKTDNKVAKQLEESFIVVGIWGKNLFGTERFGIPYQTVEMMAKKSLENENITPNRYEVVVSDEKYLSKVKDVAEQMGLTATLDIDVIGSIGKVVNMVTVILAMIAGISLIVSGIMISLVTYMGVLERTREIGILKAVGFTNTDIKRIFSFEGAIIGVLAGVIGVILATLIGTTINNIFMATYNDIAFQLYKLELWEKAVCLLFSIVLGIVCSHAAAKKAAKMEPIKALGYVT